MKKHIHHEMERCALSLLYEVAVGWVTAPPTITSPGKSEVLTTPQYLKRQLVKYFTHKILFDCSNIHHKAIVLFVTIL